MINYKLTESNEWVKKIIDGNITNEYINCSNNREYLEWLEAGNTPLPAHTEEELQEREKQIRISELKKLLSDSDFRMTFDYYKRMTPQDQTYWEEIRESWRSELRDLGV